jgi:GTP-binding protein EngB required for normal cell division
MVEWGHIEVAGNTSIVGTKCDKLQKGVHQQNHKKISAFLGLLATFQLANKFQQVY